MESIFKIVNQIKSNDIKKAGKSLLIELEDTINLRRIGLISDKDIYEKFTPLHSAVIAHDNSHSSNKVPGWIWDILIEAVDLYVTYKKVDIESLETILKRQRQA